MFVLRFIAINFPCRSITVLFPKLSLCFTLLRMGDGEVACTVNLHHISKSLISSNKIVIFDQ